MRIPFKPGGQVPPGTSITLLCAALAAGLALAAMAQERTGQPEVLTPAPQPTQAEQDARQVAEFRARYHSARQPAIALYWNHELTDRVAQTGFLPSYRTTTRTLTSGGSAGRAAKGPDTVEQFHNETLTAAGHGEDPARNALDERSDAQLRSAFVSTLGAGDVRFIDRSLMLRDGAARQNPGIDLQRNEIAALQGKARLLMQVLLVQDAQSPLGYGFRVSILDVASAATLAEFYSSALPAPAAHPGYVAINGGDGFAPAAVGPPAVGDIGHALAIETMARLAGVL